MKNRIFFTLALVFILCSISLSAQTTNENRSVGAFSHIQASSGIDVVYTKSRYAVKVEAAPDIIPKIETVVENGCLIVRKKKGEDIRTKQKMVVYAAAPQLENVTISGGSDFYTESWIGNSDVNIIASGGSDMKITKLSAKNVSLNFSGGSDAKIAELIATNCNIDASGGSDINLGVDTSNINTNTSGGSDLKLSGRTKIISINSSGGSDSNIRDLEYETINSKTSGSSDIIK